MRAGVLRGAYGDVPQSKRPRLAEFLAKVAGAAEARPQVAAFGSDEAMLAALADALQQSFPAAREILLRETGRYIRAEVIGAIPPEGFSADDLPIDGCDRWRIDRISFRA